MFRYRYLPEALTWVTLGLNLMISNFLDNTNRMLKVGCSPIKEKGKVPCLCQSMHPSASQLEQCLANLIIPTAIATAPRSTQSPLAWQAGPRALLFVYQPQWLSAVPSPGSLCCQGCQWTGIAAAHCLSRDVCSEHSCGKTSNYLKRKQFKQFNWLYFLSLWWLYGPAHSEIFSGWIPSCSF